MDEGTFARSLDILWKSNTKSNLNFEVEEENIQKYSKIFKKIWDLDFVLEVRVRGSGWGTLWNSVSTEGILYIGVLSKFSIFLSFFLLLPSLQVEQAQLAMKYFKTVPALS